jgi:STE24 endopeptidase
VFLITSAADFPLSFYSGYIDEHMYGLSNHSLSSYFFERLKSLLIGALIGMPVLLVFYFILKTFPHDWWLVFGLFIFGFSFVLNRLFPVLILPLFHKLVPIENPDLSGAIDRISQKAGVNVNGVFSFDMSKNTKKVNAAFTGIGKSKRIILGDTLISNFSNDEVVTVFAHEAGHYFHKHVLKLTLLSVAVTFGGLFLTSVLYALLVKQFGFAGPASLAALPLLSLLLGTYGFVTAPVSNIVSRKFEVEADAFALQATRDKEAFISTMNKLADYNLSEKSPNRFIEFLFHSHPSIEKRIQFARSFSV